MCYGKLQAIRLWTLGSSFRRVLVYGLFCLSLSACFSDKPLQKVELAVQGLYSAALSQKGEAVVIGSIQHGGSYWTLGDQNERRFNWDHQQGLYSFLPVVALSRDNKVALTADERRFVVWNTATGASLGFWQVEAKITSAALSNDGTYALVGLDNFEALYVDVRQGGFIHKLSHSSRVLSVAISADGGLGVTATASGVVQVWVLKAAKSIRHWERNARVNLVAINNKGEYVFAFDQQSGGVVWDARANKPLLTLPERRGMVTTARFHDKRTLLLLGTNAREIELWDWTIGKPLQRWLAPKRSVWKPEGIRFHDVAFAQSAKQIVSVASNGLLYVWEIAEH